jgi:alpha-beta hydrolase superfamily lysophospholipase
MNVDLRRLGVSWGTIAALEYEPRRPRAVGLAVGHGYSSSKQNLDTLCGFLAAHGFHVVSVDFPGHKLGASGGRLRGIGDLTETLAAAVRLARERGCEAVYAVGHSMGATTALRACAADPALTGAISIATGYGRPSALEALARGGVVDLRAGYVDGLTLPEVVAETEAVLDDALARLVGRPVLYVAAEHDLMVSRRSADALFERAPEPKTFVLVPGDHTHAGEHARGAVLAWLNELHPRAPRAEPLPRLGDAL